MDALELYKDLEPNHTVSVNPSIQCKGLTQGYAKGFALAHNVDQSMFEYMDSRPAKSQQFSDAMKIYAGSIPGNSPSFLVEGYPWRFLRQGARIVDVGGSNGYVSQQLARSYPQLNFIVQDRAELVGEEASGQGKISNSPPNVMFEIQDFLQPQRRVADAYLFRWIFHNWPDCYVLQILQQTIPALTRGARIIINESLCPESGVLPLIKERTVR